MSDAAWVCEEANFHEEENAECAKTQLQSCNHAGHEEAG